jgi:hypothetical protein
MGDFSYWILKKKKKNSFVTALPKFKHQELRTRIAVCEGIDRAQWLACQTPSGSFSASFRLLL